MLVALELLFLVFVVAVLRLVLVPYSASVTTLVVLWLLMAAASYVVGEFETTARANYGLTLRTQAAFALTYVGYSGVRVLWSWCEPMRVRFWLALWVYLTLLAPIVGLLLRRAVPQRVLFATDFHVAKRELLRWWGFDCGEVVPIAELETRLQQLSDTNRMVPGYHLIVVDTVDLRTEYLVSRLAQEYFIDFIGVRSFTMSAYLMGPHPRHISPYSLDAVARRMKRVVDLMISGIALMLLSPLFLVVAIWIKADSRGPVFYRHRRLGRNMRPFWLYKFRTMYQDAEQRLQDILVSDPVKRREFEQTFKLKDDPRVTRCGRFLRKFSIDELPQFFNIIAGQMSLVGPRPIVEKEIAYYRDYSLLLFRVSPGATGLWQVSGRTDTTYQQRVEMDTRYVREWTFLLDIKIILKTFPAILGKKGAY